MRASAGQSSGCSVPGASWPVTTVKEELSPRSLSGIPAYAGTATAELMPGTISKRIPACESACASSPPRPNTNGSPPLRRTTVLPARASAIMREWIACCWRSRCEASPLLPDGTISARGRANRSMRGSTR